METAAKHVDRESAVFERLKGAMKHFCPDWDFMAIDENCPEHAACCCEQYQVGQTEGDLCKRNGCCNRISIRPTENCSCHISPPCGACVSAPMECTECKWVGESAE